jgi:hypothetical protein
MAPPIRDYEPVADFSDLAVPARNPLGVDYDVVIGLAAESGELAIEEESVPGERTLHGDELRGHIL